MTRILADLPDDDIQWLDRLADEQGKSRAAILRGLAYQDRLRGEWDPEREKLGKERDA